MSAGCGFDARRAHLPGVTTIRFEGWHVAQMELEPPFSSWGVSDHVLLYRTPTTWTLLTVAVHERVDEQGTPVDGRGTANAETLSTEELADVVRDRYGEFGWRELLDTAHDRDPDLYRAWVPTRLERDFDRASLHCKDLALYTGLLGGRPVPAPARELPDWQADAVARMAEHLPSLGFEVDNATVAVAVDDDGDPAEPDARRAVGAPLWVRGDRHRPRGRRRRGLHPPRRRRRGRRTAVAGAHRAR